MLNYELIEYAMTLIDRLYEPMHSFQVVSREQRQSHHPSHNIKVASFNDFPGVGYYRLDFN